VKGRGHSCSKIKRILHLKEKKNEEKELSHRKEIGKLKHDRGYEGVKTYKFQKEGRGVFHPYRIGTRRRVSHSLQGGKFKILPGETRSKTERQGRLILI